MDDQTEPLEVALRALLQQSWSGFFMDDQTEPLEVTLRALSEQLKDRLCFRYYCPGIC